jgi:DNA-binding PadR family transcriptional regulator
MRSHPRIAVLRLIKEAISDGQNLSMRAKAHTNAFLQLRTEPGFPHALDRGEFFTLLKELARDGLISEATVVTPSRNRVQVIKLTEAGELRVASGSAAPAMWHARAAA